LFDGFVCVHARNCSFLVYGAIISNYLHGGIELDEQA
jgi:hypothetical protein